MCAFQLVVIIIVNGSDQKPSMVKIAIAVSSKLSRKYCANKFETPYKVRINGRNMIVVIMLNGVHESIEAAAATLFMQIERSNESIAQNCWRAKNKVRSERAKSRETLVALRSSSENGKRKYRRGRVKEHGR